MRYKKLFNYSNLNLRDLLSNANFKTSSVYLTSTIIGAGVAFFLVPILTRFLTPNDYGIVANYIALLTLASYFIMLSNSGYIFRNYFFLKKAEMKISVNNVFFINLIISIIVTIILFLFHTIIYNELGIPLNWLIFIPLIAIMKILIDVRLNLYQAQKKAKKYVSVELSYSVLNLGLSVLFVTIFLMDWRGRLLALIIATVLLSFISFYLLAKNGWIRLSLNSLRKNDIVDFLKFGIPLIPHSIGGFVLALSDRFFISSMVDVSAAGLYSVGFTFGGLLMILHAAFYKVFLQYAFENLSSTNDSDEVKSKLVKITYIYITLFVISSIGLFFIAKTIFPFFVGEKFQDAYVYVLWIALGYAMLAAYQMFGIYVIYTKKTKMVAFRTDFLAAVIKLPLTYFLIIYIGPIGAAIATFAAYFITAISAWQINNKAYPMPWFSFYKLKLKNVK